MSEYKRSTENKIEKSLRWIVNQIPDIEPEGDIEKMLLVIKHYCQAGADEIKRLETENAEVKIRIKELQEKTE